MEKYLRLLVIKHSDNNTNGNTILCKLFPNTSTPVNYVTGELVKGTVLQYLEYEYINWRLLNVNV